jgi:hypothetical protein
MGQKGFAGRKAKMGRVNGWVFLKEKSYKKMAGCTGYRAKNGLGRAEKMKRAFQMLVHRFGFNSNSFEHFQTNFELG